MNVGRSSSCLTALLLLCSAAVSAETTFTRVAEDEQNQPLALQLAIASYVPPGGDGSVQVDLVSAIHIGDAEYYHDLNERFEDYDAMLYELVAPKDAAVTGSESDRKGLISRAQIGMKNLLDLSFQLDEIDYTADNFVHADLSPAELFDSMDERGESLYVYFWRLFYASINEYTKDPLGLKNWSMMSAVVAEDSGNSLKVILAYEMTDLSKHSEILGEDSDSAVIGARNQRAIDILKERLAAGDKKVAIFYGAAHMPDMEERLLEQLNLIYLDTTWVDAWRLDARVDIE